MLYETCPSVQGGAGNNEAHLFNVATLAALGYVEAGFAEAWRVQVVKGKRKADPGRSKQGWEEKALALGVDDDTVTRVGAHKADWERTCDAHGVSKLSQSLVRDARFDHKQAEQYKRQRMRESELS